MPEKIMAGIGLKKAFMMFGVLGMVGEAINYVKEGTRKITPGAWIAALITGGGLNFMGPLLYPNWYAPDRFSASEAIVMEQRLESSHIRQRQRIGEQIRVIQDMIELSNSRNKERYDEANERAEIRATGIESRVNVISRRLDTTIQLRAEEQAK